MTSSVAFQENGQWWPHLFLRETMLQRADADHRARPRKRMVTIMTNTFIKRRATTKNDHVQSRWNKNLNMVNIKAEKQVVKSETQTQQSWTPADQIKLEGGQDIKSGFSWEWTMMATSLFVRNYAAAGRRGPPSASKKKNGDNNDRRIHQQLTKGVPQQKTTTLEVGETRVSTWWTSTFMVG